MTVLSDAALRSAIAAAINDNASRDVSPADVRNSLIDLLDSTTVISRFLTRSVAVAETIAASVKSIHTDGYIVVGDRGDADYVRMAAAPSNPSSKQYFRSVDRYKLDGTTDDT